MKTRLVALNEYGRRIGSDHHRSKIPDEVVDRLRDLHEDEKMTYKTLAGMFKISQRVVGKICRYEIRAQTVFKWKRVEVKDGTTDSV